MAAIRHRPHDRKERAMSMRVEVVTSLQGLEGLRRDWEAVYASDPEAQFFLSWSWMSGRLRSLGTSWLVLAVRPASDPSACVAFLPLSVHGIRAEGGSSCELRTAGSPVADYTGFVCRPDHEQDALTALAVALLRLRQRVPWDGLRLAGLRASAPRLQAFLSPLIRAGLEPRARRADNGDGIDQAVCPYVPLPGSWDGYLSTAIGAGTRQKIRRFLRRIEASDDLAFRVATPETMEADIEALLGFWRGQWSERKGGRAERISLQTSAMLRRASESGDLFLPTLQRRGVAVGALAILLDPAKRSCLFYIGGRDLSFAEVPAGFCLHAFAIRHAIGHGFTRYDFLRGDEPYKFLFGAQRDAISTIVVRRRPATRRAIQQGLDPKSFSHPCAGASPPSA
jgi:CelD/BcsL family acetyltransferase involved in cellulose biosynthesis